MKTVSKSLLKQVWAIFMVAYLAMAAWPASHWYDPGQLVIPTSVAGEPVELFYQGGAVRDFTGRYTVLMRDFQTQEIVCEAASGFFPYNTESKRPDPLFMDWWAPSDPRCNAPPAGQMQTTTCWTVSGILWGLVPPKHVCTDPVSHTVTPKHGSQD
jgi:hypothetical protein